MRLLSPDEMPQVVHGIVCRQSRLATLLGTTVLLAMLLGMPAFFLWHFRPPWWGLLIATIPAGFLVRWMVGHVLKSWRRTNWLVRVSPNGVWLNIRSYLNRGFPAACTIVHLPYVEIDTAREYACRRAEKSSDGTTVWTERYLELQLNDRVPDELRTELAEERRRQVTKSHLGGMVTSRSRSGHSPVTVVGENVIRVAWRSRFDWIVPSLKRTLRELRGRVRIGERAQADYSDLQNLPVEEIDKLTLQLVETGDKLGAVKLLTDRRGYSATEAHRFVEELIAGPGDLLPERITNQEPAAGTC
jgi:hypothetical protein